MHHQCKRSWMYRVFFFISWYYCVGLFLSEQDSNSSILLGVNAAPADVTNKKEQEQAKKIPNITEVQKVETDTEKAINNEATADKGRKVETNTKKTAEQQLQVEVYGGTKECEDAHKVQSGDELEMHYTGFIDESSETGVKGKKFDSSRDRGKTFRTQIGVGRVIQGWDQGIVGLCKGAKANLIIPPYLGYGASGSGAGSIPGGATLHFDVEVVDIITKRGSPPQQHGKDEQKVKAELVREAIEAARDKKEGKHDTERTAIKAAVDNKGIKTDTEKKTVNADTNKKDTTPDTDKKVLKTEADNTARKSEMDKKVEKSETEVKSIIDDTDKKEKGKAVASLVAKKSASELLKTLEKTAQHKEENKNQKIDNEEKKNLEKEEKGKDQNIKVKQSDNDKANQKKEEKINEGKKSTEGQKTTKNADLKNELLNNVKKVKEETDEKASINLPEKKGLKGMMEHKIVHQDPAPAVKDATKDLEIFHYDADAIVPLHITNGTLHAYVYVGSPPQRQILILDTGSKFMSFPCLPLCKNKESCGKHVSNYYDLNVSSTDVFNTGGPHECFYTNAEEQVKEQKTSRSIGRGMPQFDFMISNAKEREKAKHTKKTDAPIVRFGNTSSYCVVAQSYLEGSAWDAFEIEDFVWLGTENAAESRDLYLSLIGAPYIFGCQFASKGLFKTQYADGILGLADHHTNYVKYLSQQPIHHDGTKILKRYAFSFCVSKDSKYGSFALGGHLPAQTYHREPMQYTKLLKSKAINLYAAKVIAIYVGNICVTCPYDGTDKTLNHKSNFLVDYDDETGKELHIKLADTYNTDRGTIFDTGTTDTYLNKRIEEPFLEAWHLCSGESLKLNIFTSSAKNLLFTYEEFQKLCIVTIEFASKKQGISDPDKWGEIPGNGLKLAIPPTSFMEGVPMKHIRDEKSAIHSNTEITKWKGKLKLENRMYLEEEKGAVIGVNAMVGFDVLYDVEGEQIGVAKATCPE